MIVDAGGAGVAAAATRFAKPDRQRTVEPRDVS
jgi:hypothetical protein